MIVAIDIVVIGVIVAIDIVVIGVIVAIVMNDMIMPTLFCFSGWQSTPRGQRSLSPHTKTMWGVREGVGEKEG